MLGYTVATNTSGAARSATIIIGGAVFVVTQDVGGSAGGGGDGGGSGGGGAPCPVILSREGAAAPAEESQIAVAIDLPPSCAWAVSTDAPSLTVLDTAGVGPATVRIAVALNNNPDWRVGVVMVNDRPFVVSQSGSLIAAPPSPTDEAAVVSAVKAASAATTGSCSYCVYPASFTMSVLGGSNSVFLAVSTGCTWTAVSDVAWATISNETELFHGRLFFTTQPNWSTDDRVGHIQVGYQSIEITQRGLLDSVGVTPPSIQEIDAPDESQVGECFGNCGGGCGSFPPDILTGDPLCGGIRRWSHEVIGQWYFTGQSVWERTCPTGHSLGPIGPQLRLDTKSTAPWRIGSFRDEHPTGAQCMMR